MYLKSFRKVNANRFTKRVNNFNSNFLQICNVLTNIRMNSLFFYKYKKISKFYNKKNIFYSSRILKPLNFTKLLVFSPYSLVSIKKLANTNSLIGLCEIKIHDSDIKKYNLYKQIPIDAIITKKYNNIKHNGTLFFIKLFYGYRLGEELYNLNTIFKNSNFEILTPGSINILRCFPIGATIYNLIDRSKKIFYSTAPGTYSTFLDSNMYDNTAMVELPSGLIKKFNLYNIAILGRNANILFKFTVLGKASGKFFLKKKNITVRGIAMNPVDHPNGGRTKIKKPFRTVWGWVAKNNK